MAYAVSVSLPGNADYTATAATFAAGSTGGTQNVVLDDVDDLIVEAQETFTAQALAVTSGGGAIVVAGSRDVVIDDNDSASVAITTPGTTTVTEGGLSADVSVTLTLNTTGTGTPSLGVPISVNLPGNADYTATAATFAAGS